MKTHYRDIQTEAGMDKAVRDRYAMKNLFGAACGYMRQPVTMSPSKVTCFYCLKAMVKAVKS